MLWLYIILAVLLGILAGTVTGLIPGVHINLVAVILLSVAGFFLKYVLSLRKRLKGLSHL